MTLTDSSIGNPHSVPLSGTGQDFAVSTDKPSASVTAGGTATFNLSVASQGGFTHSLDLTCTDPASLSICTVSPASVNPTAAKPATATVSVTTTASSQVGPRGPKGPRPFAGHRPALQLWVFALALLALLAVAAMSWHGHPGHGFIPRAGRPCHVGAHGPSADGRPLPLCLLALALLLVLAWAACGEGSTVHNPGTPAGTYTITIKATGTTANLSHSTTVTLTVQ